MPLDSQTFPAGEPDWRLARRRKIVAAATLLFGRAAFDAVQMDHVARQARVGKPTLYRYFPSKDELFLVVTDAALAELEQRLMHLKSAEGPAPEVLASMIETLVDGLSRQVASLHFLTDGHSGLAERWRRLYSARRRPIVELLRAVIERGIATGELRPIDPEIVPALVMGMIRGGLAGAPKRTQARIAAAATDLILNGSIARPTDGPRSRRTTRRRTAA